MIFIVTAENRALFARDLQLMHRQRKAAFVDRLGWRVPVTNGAEIDAFDRADTTYLLCKDSAHGALLASARLLPTTGPHLMRELFAHTCTAPAPSGASVWEVSRFCTSAQLPAGRSRAALLLEIMCGVVETALLFDVEEIIFTANAALLPHALNCGWSARRLGPTLTDGRDQMTAVAALMTPQAMRALRGRLGVAGPVTRFNTDDGRIAA